MAWNWHDYQTETIDKVRAYIDGGGKAGFFTAPTGSGKGPFQAQLAWDGAARGEKVLSVVHTAELIRQNVEAFREIGCRELIGSYSAGLGARDTRTNIIVAGIQSAFRRPERFGKVHRLILDECHFGADGAMVEGLIEGLRRVNPDLIVIGMSATVFKPLRFLPDKIHSISVRGLIRDGFLCPIWSPATDTTIDTSGVDIVAGDFDKRQLESITNTEDVNKAVIADLMKHASDRKHIMLMALSVDHAAELAKEAEAAGLSCSLAYGDLTMEERGDALDLFKGGFSDAVKALRAGNVEPMARFNAQPARAISSMALLTTGFNHRPVDCIALVRATRSPELYAQIGGRGMRTCPETGKVDCMLRDYGRVVHTLGPIDLLEENIDEVKTRLKKRKGDLTASSPVKLCQNCGTFTDAKVDACCKCGHISVRKLGATLAEKLAKIDKKATGGEVISRGQTEGLAGPGEALAQVKAMLGIQLRKTPGRPDSLMLTYDTTRRAVSVFLNFGMPDRRTSEIWTSLGLGTVPRTASEAVSIMANRPSLPVPSHIVARKSNDGRHWNTQRMAFVGQPEAVEPLRLVRPPNEPATAATPDAKRRAPLADEPAF